MKKMTKEMILNKAKELNIKFIRLRFTDILGMPKNVEIPVRELGKALNGEIMFDGSSIQGFVRIEESDMYLKPDYSCLLYTSPSPRDATLSRMPSSA